MKSTKKIVIGILVFAVIVPISLQFIAKSKLSDYLDHQMPDHIGLDYNDLSLNIITGSAAIDQVEVRLYNSDRIVYGHFQTEKLAINGFSAWGYIFNKNYSVKEIVVSDPGFKYYPFHKDTVARKSAKKRDVAQNIIIDNLLIENGSYYQFKNGKDSVGYSLDKLRLSLKNISTNKDKDTKSDLPFDFTIAGLSAHNIFIDLNKYESVRVASLNSENDLVQLDSVQIIPKHSKEALSKILKRERDHISLLVPQLNLYSFDQMALVNSNLLACDSIGIYQAKLEVYRDKRVNDDNRYKKLYSRMLRELGLKINIPKITVRDGYISYAEKVNTENNAGEIYFANVEATIENLNNLKNNTAATDILATSRFMGKAAMELNWEFEINNTRDTFMAKGYFKNFNANIANTFFKNNLHIKVDGEISQIYYTFSGDAVASTGDLKMKYDNFKLAILDKEGKEKKKFLSSLGNLFVKNSSDKESDNFKEGKIKVERNTTKSFFNYLWINLEDGLKDVLL